MLLNPFLQLGKLRQRPLQLELVVPRDSAVEFVPVCSIRLLESIARCPSPQARPGRVQESCSDQLSHAQGLPADRKAWDLTLLCN